MNKILAAMMLLSTVLSAQEIKISKEEPLDIKADLFRANGKTRTVVHEGNVVIKHAGSVLTADKVTFYQDSKKYLAEKNVVFKEKSRGSVITGGYGEYYSDTKTLVIKENAVMTTKDKDEIVTNIRADVIQLYDENNKAVVTGNVEMVRDDMRILCANAVYENTEEKITIEGEPKVFKKKDTFEGKKMVMYLKKRFLVIDKEVKAKVYAQGMQ